MKNARALLTVSKVWAHMEAGKSTLTTSDYLNVSREFLLVRLLGIIFVYTASACTFSLLNVCVSAEFLETGNSMLTASVFHRVAGNFCLCVCMLHVTRNSLFTQLAQKLGACTFSKRPSSGD